MDDDSKITIKFELTDESENHFVQETTIEVFTSLGETDIDVVGAQLNIFLKQCGYIRENDNIFMEDITDEEYDALADYLSELRKNKELE